MVDYLGAGALDRTTRCELRWARSDARGVRALNKGENMNYRVRLLAALVALGLPLSLATPATGNEEPPPQGCKGTLNNVHKSTHFPTAGSVKVYGETTCASAMEVISVSVELYKETPAGNVLEGVSSDPVELNKPKIGRSAVGSACVPGWYNAVAQHYAKLGSYVWTATSTTRGYVDCA